MKPVEDVLPTEISDVFSSLGFDDEAGIVIESVEFAEKDIHIIFSIRFEQDTTNQLWRLQVNDVEEERIISEWTPNINIYKEHVLLLDYIDNYSELYFKGTTTNSEALFIDIFKSITQLSEDLSDISKYIFPPERITELSCQGYGLFARGPVTILREYERCLLKHGIKPIFIGEIKPTADKKQLRLITIGNSYCIGRTFQFERKA
jgi:hypothetical protein